MAATFPGVIAFAFLVSMILFGTIIRAKIVFFQTNLVPASLIGGVLGFILISTGLSFGLDNTDFTAFAFHFFTLSFMSLVLTGSGKKDTDTDIDTEKEHNIAAGGMWLSIIWVMSLVLQAMVGLAAILIYNHLSGGQLSHFLGIIVTHGFTQGPGQAIAMGNIWQNQYGIEHVINFGLVYASIGFFVAFVVGIPIARRSIRLGLNYNQAARIDDEFLKGIMQTHLSSGKQITHPANVDSLAYHIAILGLAYLITDQYLILMNPIASATEINGINFGIIFSHNLFFIHGLMICLIMRKIMDKAGYGHMIDDETQRRITGSSVDLMVVGTLMSVGFGFLSEFAIPILLVSVSATAATAALCFGFGRKLRDFGPERALTAYGCCCGSTGSGLLLLRIMDPNLSTPVAKELAFFNIAILVLSAHILMVMAPILPSFSLLTIALVYIGTFSLGAVTLVLIDRKKALP